MPSEVITEASKNPKIIGETGVEVAGRLISQQHRVRAALRRAISLYEDCRKS